ncbi:MAG: hypothetical protein RJQ01_02155 [Microcella sp.]|uniref:hypothetical protein n=1 Tax=Microcella sp. TaxID=1913979 RepID=UPI003315ACE2
MTRTLATAIPVWIAVVVAVALAAALLPEERWGDALPAIAGGALLVTFVVQVSLQLKEGFVTRLLVTTSGIVLILAAATGLLLIIAGVD